MDPEQNRVFWTDDAQPIDGPFNDTFCPGVFGLVVWGSKIFKALRQSGSPVQETNARKPCSLVARIRQNLGQRYMIFWEDLVVGENRRAGPDRVP